MKRIVLLSGAHGSAMTALNVADRFGTDDLYLVNHNINNKKESADIKRFKMEIAAYLKKPITYANYKGIQDDSLIPNQFDICKVEKQVTTPFGDHICTSRLKTKPFMKWLEDNCQDKDCVIYYGFDKTEGKRILRRSTILAAKGYKTDFPLALWPVIKYTSSNQIGILPPLTYGIWEHANCIGCLKAGLLHWYVVYCTDIEAYREGIEMEEVCNYVIHTIKEKGVKINMSLKELMPLFCQIKALGVKPTEHQNKIKFGRALKRLGISEDKIFKPCDCVV